MTLKGAARVQLQLLPGAGVSMMLRLRTAACEVFDKLVGDDGIDTAALESVSGLADHRNFDVRQAVTVMLGRIAKPGDVVATKVLIKALGDDDWHVRGAAVMAICQFAGRRCVDSVS